MKVHVAEKVEISRKAEIVLGYKEIVALLENAGVDLHDKYTVQISVDGFPHAAGGWSLDDQGKEGTHVLVRWEKPGKVEESELEVTFDSKD